MELDVLEEAIDSLCAGDLGVYADAESVERFHRLARRLEAATTEVTTAFDSAGNWVPSGARSAAGWLAAVCKMPGGEARREIRRGRALRHLPVCEKAWLKGDIGGAHVDAVVGVRNDVTAAALARDESILVRQATSLSYRDFVRALGYWHQLADPDGVELDAAKVLAKRSVYLNSSYDGTWLGQMTFDPVSGAIVAGELSRIEKEMFEAEWKEATAGRAHEPTSVKLSRTPGQRRADALVEMAVRSRSAPADAKRPAPLFSVLVGYETLHGRVCELAGGTVVTPGALLPWLDQALIERVVFAPGNRVEVSTTARLFGGATRRAIEVRDRQCTHPMCEESTRRLEVDHIVPYSENGLTIQENGRLRCGFHNRLRNGREPPDRS
ncbi:MAG: DUF222 domain-containing protein [Acidimicrobiales bacterium]